MPTTITVTRNDDGSIGVKVDPPGDLHTALGLLAHAQIALAAPTIAPQPVVRPAPAGALHSLGARP